MGHSLFWGLLYVSLPAGNFYGTKNFFFYGFWSSFLKKRKQRCSSSWRWGRRSFSWRGQKEAPASELQSIAWNHKLHMVANVVVWLWAQWAKSLITSQLGWCPYYVAIYNYWLVMLSHTQTMAFLEFNCEDVSFTLNPEYDSQARQQQIPRLRRNWFRALDSDGIASTPRTICDIVS